MRIFALSDLHLGLGVNKPMDRFGSVWHQHHEKIQKAVRARLGADDWLLIPGDISWAINVEQARLDLQLIHELPGKKLLLRGNHDYWWTSMSKVERFARAHALTSLYFIDEHFKELSAEASAQVAPWLVAGCRLWTNERDFEKAEDAKILERELQKLERVTQRVRARLESGENDPNRTVLMLHYPPFSRDCEQNRATDLIEESGIKRVIYGHLHGHAGKESFEGVLRGVRYQMVAGDHVAFWPQRVDED